MEKDPKKIIVEVAYAGNCGQAIIVIQLDQGATVLQAIETSKLLSLFSEVDVLEGQIGIFGKVVPLDTKLKEGDRVEIYRRLLQDPKETRRARAKVIQRGGSAIKKKIKKA